MSNSSKIGDNPNDKMPAGVPLEHDEVASDDAPGHTASTGGRADDDGLGPLDEEENEPGVPLQGNPESEAGTNSVDRDKFERD